MVVGFYHDSSVSAVRRLDSMLLLGFSCLWSLRFQAVPLAAKPKSEPVCAEHEEKLKLWCDRCKVSTDFCYFSFVHV